MATAEQVEQTDPIDDEVQYFRPVTLQVDESGQLTIPVDVVAAMGLEPGESVEIEKVLFSFLLVPIRTDEEMEVFYGPDWLAKLERVKAEVGSGRSTFYESGEAFLADLEAIHRAHV